MLPFELYWYYLDVSKRMLLYVDAMQQRHLQQKELEERGDSGVFTFPCEKILCGSDLQESINYDLLEVTNEAVSGERPYIFIDPRAGRGPGICGSKDESELGYAIKNGNPVYFITFRPTPEKGQNIEKVFRGIAFFVNHIAKKHSADKDPVIVGNCQAGWMAAIVAARYLRHLKCPLILAGAPLSYWSSIGSMKYKGFLSGGSVWPAIASDIGGGLFDGANLSLNFECHDASRVIGEKLNSLFENPESKLKTFLKNERWWNFFCHMTKEEIVWIVENLFIGNKLERGALVVDGECISLRDITGPIITFFSHGDTITPPAQAVSWVDVVYKQERNINTPVVYVVHPSCGHLAIFVSALVAREYHRRIYAEIENIESLPGGIYELVVEPGVQHAIQERSLEDIRAFIERGNVEEENALLANLAKQSAHFRKAYELTLSPLVQNMFWYRGMLKQVHPMRFTRKLYGTGLQSITKLHTTYTPAMENNVYKKTETIVRDACIEWWKYWENVHGKNIQHTVNNICTWHSWCFAKSATQ